MLHIYQVYQFHQYLIKIDGSGRQTLRNRNCSENTFLYTHQPAKRRSILEDIAHLPPTSPPDDTTTSPKLHTHPPHKHLNTPRMDTTPLMTPTRTDIEVETNPSTINLMPPQLTPHQEQSKFRITHQPHTLPILPQTPYCPQTLSQLHLSLPQNH